MNALAQAPMSPDCPAPPLAMRKQMSVALVNPPLYTACGASAVDAGRLPILPYRPSGTFTYTSLERLKPPKPIERWPIRFGTLRKEVRHQR